MNLPREAILGRRRLSILGEKRRRFVTVTVTTPRCEKPLTWSCELRVSGGGLRIKRRILGADALQAVQLTLGVAAQTLASSALRLSWGNPDEHSVQSGGGEWTGFDTAVPLFFGPDGDERNKRVRAFLECENRDYARAVRARVEAEYARRGVPVPANVRAGWEGDAG